MSKNDQHQKVLILLAQSGLQKSNPALFQLIQILTGILDEIDSLPDLDFGQARAKSTDTTGTRVNFNVLFNSVNVIATPILSTDAMINVVSTTGTYFTVMAFNDAGVRISCNFSWWAYGIKQL